MSKLKKIFSLSVLISFIISPSIYALSLSEELEKELSASNYLAELGIIKDVAKDIDITWTEYELIWWWETLAVIDAYRLSDTITRKETMKIVMKLSGLTVEESCEWKFKDVPNDWWCKYIESALKAWFIAENDNFRPDDNITKTESMKLVLKAKWLEKTRSTLNRQEDYMETAYEYGIIDKKYYNFNADAKRWWIFVITTATIEKEEEIKEKIKEKMKR